MDLKEGVIISDAGSTKSMHCGCGGALFGWQACSLCRGPSQWLVVTRQGLLLRMSISLKMPIISLHLRV